MLRSQGLGDTESACVVELVSGQLAPGQTLVLLSDGVPEARSASGELYGFDRLAQLTLFDAQEIARRAQHFGQEDDITVLSLSLAGREVAQATPTL